MKNTQLDRFNKRQKDIKNNKINVKLAVLKWCQWNSKIIKESDFIESIGFTPNEFFKAFKKETLKRWNEWCRDSERFEYLKAIEDATPKIDKTETDTVRIMLSLLESMFENRIKQYQNLQALQYSNDFKCVFGFDPYYEKIEMMRETKFMIRNLFGPLIK